MVCVHGMNVPRYFYVQQLHIDPAQEKNGLDNLEVVEMMRWIAWRVVFATDWLTPALRWSQVARMQIIVTRYSRGNAISGSVNKLNSWPINSVPFGGSRAIGHFGTELEDVGHFCSGVWGHLSFFSWSRQCCNPATQLLNAINSNFADTALRASADDCWNWRGSDKQVGSQQSYPLAISIWLSPLLDHTQGNLRSYLFLILMSSDMFGLHVINSMRQVHIWMWSSLIHFVL